MCEIFGAEKDQTQTKVEGTPTRKISFEQHSQTFTFH